ncbi:L,D-transpeptidase family protein [Alloiococcus sp. CFN-8]|uniref:L,D-transpeptidase family protein n=1 Tax=Alloiococcus sp. CFN-8 TaxID=3416081 RepID=UPI003CED116B
MALIKYNNIKALKSFLLVFFCFLLIFLCLYLDISTSASEPSDKKTSKHIILIDVNELQLYLIDKESKETIKKYSIAVGALDSPSPLGTWKITSKGQWNEGFGGRWLGLNVPWGIYGIHGTTKPSSIGSFASHGCIRMFNADAKDLYSRVNIGTSVVIYGGANWLFTSYVRTLVPGDRGADVYGVQERLKDLCYYKSTIDGIYGEGLKKSVLDFREDHDLPISHNIDMEMLKAMDIFKFE